MTNETITKLVVDLSKPEGDPDRVKSIPLTQAELDQREQDRIAAEAEEAQRVADENAKQEAKASAMSKLEALGLTESEISAIVGA